jgi:hypothetical protein
VCQLSHSYEPSKKALIVKFALDAGLKLALLYEELIGFQFAHPFVQSVVPNAPLYETGVMYVFEVNLVELLKLAPDNCTEPEAGIPVAIGLLNEKLDKPT